MTCSSNDSGSGCKSNCCCDPITLLRGGLHTDHYRTVSQRVFSGRREQLLVEPACILSITVSAAVPDRGSLNLNSADFSGWSNPQEDPPELTSRSLDLLTPHPMRWTSQSLRFFTSPSGDDDPGPIDQAVDKTILVLDTETNTAMPKEYFGLFCDQGLYVENRALADSFDAASVGISAFINILYVVRENFVPAFVPPSTALQHHWSCWNDTPFGHNFDSGDSGQGWDGADVGSPPGPDVWEVDGEDLPAAGMGGQDPPEEDEEVQFGVVMTELGETLQTESSSALRPDYPLTPDE